jgi:hypothetical protein
VYYGARAPSVRGPWVGVVWTRAAGSVLRVRRRSALVPVRATAMLLHICNSSRLRCVF